MIYILIIVVIIIILLLCVVYYSQDTFSSNNIEGFSNYGNIRNLILNDNNFLSNNLGILKYNGSIFEANNKHNFVFRKSNSKLQNFGKTLNNFPTNDFSSNALLFQNHDSFCVLDDNKLYCFGNENTGGNLPSNIETILEYKTISNVYSTNEAYCALTTDKNIYCWGNTDSGGVIPPNLRAVLRNNILKVFSNKNTFIVIFSNQKKIRTWGTIEMPNSLLNLRNVKNVFSNDNTFIVLYEEVDVSQTKQKIKCFASGPKYILNKNNIENLDNIKTIYSNSESFIAVYGANNRVEVCGNNNFLGELIQDKSNLSNIVHVVSNHGAYCLLDSNGDIHIYGHQNYLVNLPSVENRRNIKKIYSNYGAFVAVNNENKAIVFGLKSHGYVNNNNIILNVKDVYLNGDEAGGAILFIKNGSENVLCLGHSDYAGNSILLLNSLSVKEVYPNTHVFYYKDSNDKIKAIGDISRISNYNSNTVYIKDNSNIYSNNHLLSKYDVSDFERIINYDVSSIPTVDSSLVTTSISTTASTSLEDTNINYYIWNFDNNKENITNNNVKWNITTNDLNYTITDSSVIMAKLDLNYPIISFNNKTFDGDTYSISFRLKIHDLDKTFTVFSMLNIKLKYQDRKLNLLYKNTVVRVLNINESNNLITLTFTNNEIKIYKNISEITYGNNVNYSLDTINYNLELGNNNSNSNDDESSFSISNLLIMENYKLNNENIRQINNDLNTFITNFNLSTQTTQVALTTASNIEQNTTSSLSNTNQVTESSDVTIPVVTKSIFETQNFLTIMPVLQDFPLKLKTKTSNNISFIKDQISNNMAKLTDFKNKLKNNTTTLYIRNNYSLSKVSDINYRGLTFDYNAYMDEIDGKMYYIFELNNDALLNILKLKYLDIEQINKIYTQNNRYGSVNIMILGTKTLPSNPIYQIKENIYLISYVDIDNIYRFQQIRVDLNYFYNIFNFEFMKLYINEDLPRELSENLVTVFYENLQDNVSQNFDNIIFNDNDEDNIFKSIIISVFKNKVKTQEINIFNNIQKQNNKCTFNPSGNTLFECRQLCSNDLNLSCSQTQCNNICNSCNTEACKWNFSKKNNEKKLRPDKSKIKGFQGNKFIKVTWIKPQSKSEITKYYIVLTTPTNKDFIQIYSFYDNRELPEYIVKNLTNGIPYSVSVISKNKIGVSDVSNIETVIPNEFSELDDYEQENSYDNSLQNYYKESKDGIDISFQKSIYEKQTIINELKDILINKLKIEKPLGVYTVNIF